MMVFYHYFAIYAGFLASAADDESVCWLPIDKLLSMCYDTNELERVHLSRVRERASSMTVRRPAEIQKGAKA